MSSGGGRENGYFVTFTSDYSDQLSFPRRENGVILAGVPSVFPRVHSDASFLCTNGVKKGRIQEAMVRTTMVRLILLSSRVRQHGPKQKDITYDPLSRALPYSGHGVPLCDHFFAFNNIFY